MSELVVATVPCLCVVEVQATPDYMLRLAFSDGSRKVVNFRPLLEKPIYKGLNDVSLFMQAESDGCGVIWNDDLDIDPVYLYEHSYEEIYLLKDLKW